jgi:hypothetical protein
VAHLARTGSSSIGKIARNHAPRTTGVSSPELTVNLGWRACVHYQEVCSPGPNGFYPKCHSLISSCARRRLAIMETVVLIGALAIGRDVP